MKYRRPGGLKNRNLLPYSFRGWKSKIQVLAGLVPSEGCEGRVCSRPNYSSGRWSSSAYVPSHCLPWRCLCVLVSSSYKETSHSGLEPALVTSF